MKLILTVLIAMLILAALSWLANTEERVNPRIFRKVKDLWGRINK